MGGSHGQAAFDQASSARLLRSSSPTVMSNWAEGFCLVRAVASLGKEQHEPVSQVRDIDHYGDSGSGAFRCGRGTLAGRGTAAVGTKCLATACCVARHSARVNSGWGTACLREGQRQSLLLIRGLGTHWKPKRSQFQLSRLAGRDSNVGLPGFSQLNNSVLSVFTCARASVETNLARSKRFCAGRFTLRSGSERESSTKLGRGSLRRFWKYLTLRRGWPPGAS